MAFGKSAAFAKLQGKASAVSTLKYYSMHRFTSILLFLATLVCTIALLELGYRALHGWRAVCPPYDTAQRDATLGWAMKPGYAWEGPMWDADGSERRIHIRYDAHGFKMFGDTTSSRPRILVVGDSYTASIEVSNEDAYFHLLADSLDAEVFALGHAGYGTLQEWLLLQRWIPRIRPRLIIWQVCSNDFIDNYAPLERLAAYKVSQPRPYFQADGTIEWEDPRTFSERVKEWLHLWKWAAPRCQQLFCRLREQACHTAEWHIAHEGMDWPPFAEAVRRTEAILELAARALPDTVEVAVFSADRYQPQLDTWRRLATRAGFLFADEPAIAVEKAQKAGCVVHAIDHYHWNVEGHRLIANELLRFVSENNLMKH